jgi:hypothetical protein
LENFLENLSSSRRSIGISVTVFNCYKLSIVYLEYDHLAWNHRGFEKKARVSKKKIGTD